jgi:hypothetical protein
MGPPEFIIVAAIVLALILLGIAVVILRTTRSASPEPLVPGVLSFFGFIGCVLIGLFLFPIFLFLMGPIGVVAWAILPFVIVEGVQKYRSTRQYGLLWLLTVSAERFMPLAPAIEAFARERRGSFSRRARRLAEMLKAGVALPDALDGCPGLLPRYAVPTIRIGCETGTLAPALRQAATAHTLQEPIWMALQGKITYLLLLPTFGFLLLVFIMLKIVPSFEKIFTTFIRHCRS